MQPRQHMRALQTSSAPWSRATAATVVHQVVHQGVSLDAALANLLQCDSLPKNNVGKHHKRDIALVHEMSYGVLRWYWPLAFIANELLHKPHRAQNELLLALTLVGLYQLKYMRTPDYAAIAETVNAAQLLKMPWAGPVVNGVLRNFQRRGQQVCDAMSDNTRYSCPSWLLQRLQHVWPTHWRDIVAYNNAKAPFTLRLNTRRLSRDAYLAKLQAQGIVAQPCTDACHGITLAHACDVHDIPGFNDGLVSVQDESAQLAAPLLDVQRDNKVLDLCAAPGGKTCHLLQLQPDIQLTAIDHSVPRLLRVRDTLQRCNVRATLVTADAIRLGAWWPHGFFDRILLDAPCSASGVIARHADIKHLRRERDISEYAKMQRAMLQSCWCLLKPGGRLVYASCSVLPEENHEQIRSFLQANDDAKLCALPASLGVDCGAGIQRLPGVHGGDGFFYACIARAVS